VERTPSKYRLQLLSRLCPEGKWLLQKVASIKFEFFLCRFQVFVITIPALNDQQPPVCNLPPGHELLLSTRLTGFPAVGSKLSWLFFFFVFDAFAKIVWDSDLSAYIN